ncbi:uncharacterized protein L969DRAFT_49525 [Mixia osmundae IAM 14324]|uniref:Cation efflux protein transmembrane domain-containing protein n=1 Tax=Mixia osmundae (strain CBS 9802 / IAM 14324 / JCM 22182 / KY 12970) TaxID=764103 RepID=G7E8B1_MIXOS|nr:uncharacterized protein L969DRAFT_49525 [Mixia osmundae IAM 14324]KEI39174.1 hypothetical protein L969DRAFT_49525 [Mixia osmundae IAM 14324]GAA99071.1 hypothetical protein E5Q_05760 [Mixia osmundae IAM 14324]
MSADSSRQSLQLATPDASPVASPRELALPVDVKLDKTLDLGPENASDTHRRASPFRARKASLSNETDLIDMPVLAHRATQAGGGDIDVEARASVHPIRAGMIRGNSTATHDPFKMRASIKGQEVIDDFKRTAYGSPLAAGQDKTRVVAGNLVSSRQGAPSVTPSWRLGLGLLRSRGRRYKKIGDFYEGQNRQIDILLKPLHWHRDEERQREEDNRLKVKIAIYASLVANCVLAIIQVYAAVSSLSLSFFATAIDAVFDPAANFVLNWVHRKAVRADPVKYPIGGARIAVIGNIIFAVVMGTASVILIVESIQSLATSNGEDERFHVPAVVAVSVALITKIILAAYCYTLRDMSIQVHVLWEDHRNDTIINLLGLATSSAGSKLDWHIDPSGAIVISCLLIYLWGSTCAKHFIQLAGRAAPEDFSQLVTYHCVTFSDKILKIDSVKCYCNAEDYVVEVDIVLDPLTPLWEAHDLSQDLQDQLETLPSCSRAYVHVDHEVDHKPEHRKQD